MASNFKLVVIRADGLSYESTFGGWHAETACFHFYNVLQEDKRVIAAYVFDGHKSEHSSDIVYYPRTAYKAADTKET